MENVRSLYPLQHPREWVLYKELKNYDWRADQMDLSDFTNHFSELLDGEKEAFRYMISAAIKDCSLFKTISFDLLKDFKEVEILSFISYQLMSDLNHHEVYSIIQQKPDLSHGESQNFVSVHFSDIYEMKAAWLKKIKTFPERVIAYSCLKGIVGSCRIYVILSLLLAKKMKCLSQVINHIRRDLEVQREFAESIFHFVRESIDQDSIKLIVKEAVAMEIKFADEITLWMRNSERVALMKSFINHYGNLVLANFGCSPEYDENEGGLLRLLSKFEITRFPVITTDEEVPLSACVDGEAF